jgi:hypothetical protein
LPVPACRSVRLAEPFPQFNGHVAGPGQTVIPARDAGLGGKVVAGSAVVATPGVW